MSRLRALLLYLAMSVPFGIAIHLGAEFAGLGRDADDLAFSPMHGYLAVVAVAAAAIFLIAAGFFVGPAERRRRIARLSEALPFRGRGAAFLVFSAVVQFGFFLVTQLGEGCPLCHGDLLIGIAVALCASIAGAYGLAALGREIARAVAAYGISREREPRAPDRIGIWRIAFAPASTYSTFAATLGNRPPPVVS